MDPIAKIMRLCQFMVFPFVALSIIGGRFLESFGPTVHRLGVYVQATVLIQMLGLAAFRVNRVRQRVKRENYLLCMKRMYSLGSLPASGRCPECGTPYDVEKLKEDWVRSLKKAPF